jgi:cytoskeleton protein RodZ
MDFSELRHARERMGLSLRDVADRTKIRAAILDAIENNDADRLPPPIFARGFVKAYAREVGLDPETVAGRYLPEPADAPAGHAARTRDWSVGDGASADAFAERATSNLITTALIVGASLLFIVPDLWKPAGRSAPAGPSVEVAEPSATRGTAIATAVATTGAARTANVRLELQPQGPCWVEATADGTRVIYRLLNAGDRYALEGFDDLVLRVGDPAVLAFSIDGSPGRQLGAAGQPATVHLTRENSRQFVGSRN